MPRYSPPHPPRPQLSLPEPPWLPNDLIVSRVIRKNEMQVWFVAEHSVDTPLVQAT